MDRGCGWIERQRWRKDKDYPSLHVGMAGHGWKSGCGLSDIRNVAISLVRQPGYPYIPDAQRAIAAQPSLVFALLGIKD